MLCCVFWPVRGSWIDNVRRQPQRLIEFPIGQQTGITGDVCAMEFETNLTIKIDPQGIPFAFTHRIPQSMSCVRASHLLFCRLNTTRETAALSFYLGNAGSHTFAWC